MKGQRGITLISLIITVIILTIVTGMISMMSSNFMSNTKYITDNAKYIAEYNKFNMYFLEDINKNEKIYSVTENELVFMDGTVYTYVSSPDNGIYRNKVKICSNVTNCIFESGQIANSNKKTVKVRISIDGLESFQSENEYVLKYW